MEGFPKQNKFCGTSIKEKYCKETKENVNNKLFVDFLS